MRARALRCYLGAISCLLGGAAAARADWLVMKDGARLETRGPWTVQGALVRLTLPDGMLASLRVAEVDLEASAAASRQARMPAAAPRPTASAPAPRRAPVMVITDRDVGHVDPRANPQSQSGAAAAPVAAPVAAVVVTRWDRGYSEQEQGVVVTGTVKNQSAQIQAPVSVTVRLFDERGELIGTSPAVLTAEALVSGDSAQFRAVFPGVLTFATASFDVMQLAYEPNRRLSAEGSEARALDEAETPPPPPPGSS